MWSDMMALLRTDIILQKIEYLTIYIHIVEYNYAYS